MSPEKMTRREFLQEAGGVLGELLAGAAVASIFTVPLGRRFLREASPRKSYSNSSKEFSPKNLENLKEPVEDQEIKLPLNLKQPEENLPTSKAGVKKFEIEEIEKETRSLEKENVPFFSQFHPGLPEDIRAMGCGPVSLAMELAYRDKIKLNLAAVKGVTRRAQCLGLWTTSGTNILKMEKLARTYGIAAEHRILNGLDELQELLETSQNPVMVGFRVDGNLGKIGHLLLVLEIDQEKGLVYTHDSATKPYQNGKCRAYPLPLFEQVWTNQGRWALNFDDEMSVFDEDGLPLYLLSSVLAWREKIKEWSKEYGVDTKTIAVLMQLESAGNAQAVSSAGALGLFQAMRDKFKPGEDPFNPDINAKRGLGYFINKCLKRAKDLGYKDLDALVEAAKGYNGGVGVVGKTVSGETSLFERFFRGFYIGDHRVIDEWYCLYARHL